MSSAAAVAITAGSGTVIDRCHQCVAIAWISSEILPVCAGGLRPIGLSPIRLSLLEKLQRIALLLMRIESVCTHCDQQGRDARANRPPQAEASVLPSPPSNSHDFASGQKKSRGPAAAAVTRDSAS